MTNLGEKLTDKEADIDGNGQIIYEEFGSIPLVTLKVLSKFLKPFGIPKADATREMLKRRYQGLSMSKYCAGEANPKGMEVLLIPKGDTGEQSSRARRWPSNPRMLPGGQVPGQEGVQGALHVQGRFRTTVVPVSVNDPLT